MIGNIVDNRKNKYNVNVTAIFEPSRHDNSCKDATQFTDIDAPDYFCYHEIESTTVTEACNWASQKEVYVTIYLYNQA